MFHSVLVALLYTVLVSNSSWSLSISNRELEKLESLIKAYKDTAASSFKDGRRTLSLNNKRTSSERGTSYSVEATTERLPQHHQQEVDAAKVGLQIMAQFKGKQCGAEARLGYQLCTKNALSRGAEEACASTFVETYQKCFFGDTLTTGSKDLMHCSGSCLWNFDNCLMSSNKVEMFVCINARNRCSSNCPWPQNNQVSRKRSSTNCYSVCEGKFDQCYDIAPKPTDIMVCGVNRHLCRQLSTCSIES